ncbi:ArsR family transcriptional regulator [Streptomyces sp. NPDC001274]
MTADDQNAPNASTGRSVRADAVLPEHEVRTALLALLAEVGTATATEAAARLGHSSGLCSFHLRQLARHGHIEEAPHTGGRARPWRLRRDAPDAPDVPDPDGNGGGFDDLARGLEDESWQRWLDRRETVPPRWRHDEAFSEVAYLTPEEMGRVADAVRQALAPYRDREQRPLARPGGARPVALVTRLFPLLPHSEDRPPTP